MRFVHHADAGTEFRQYRAGELDVSYIVPPQQFGWIRQNLQGELHISPQLSVYYYGFNLERAPFKDQPGLRRALSLVTDRDRLTSAVTGLGEAPAYGWVPRGVAGYTPQQFDYASWPYAERIRQARELYEAAGYSAERRLEVEIRYKTGDVHNRLAVAVASMWKEALGVESTLYAEEFRALLQSIQEHGFVPADTPRFAMIVVVYEPRGRIYGGVVAAPVFREISRQALSYLNVPREDTAGQPALLVLR